ncbi:DUF2334 domain-containing protein [Tumebacillus sp. DT12]|uniref:DUF2334 domain-containing protein n=1 Tax=Tumebacillus lacus TaxID=2995335 RepID=A0ABT3X2M2_9BACL|nr:DUF2334 domain-containing protein [Tumebacillus lacus]MCX7571158.1 DUF2334 domain-containing protein [Tumebacillus lacus]
MKKALLALLLAAALAVPVPHDARTNSFPNHDKQHAMLRLEDVGPGGSYETPDDLGKLRAIFDYLYEAKVPYHVTVISRSKHLQADGTWYDKGIDDPTPDENVRQFIRLLRTAEGRGAVLGMHGYSHQYGDRERSDANHITGTGNEFNIEDAPETQTAAYASDRINKSLHAFQKAGFTPAFFEAPHYHDTREQEEVFRSHIGILYQPDFRSLRALKDISVYETINVHGRTTLGSVYVPAPLKYIANNDSVAKVLDRLDTYKGLGAMYYHPFLEFHFLEPVLDDSGQPVLRDGLPEYRYKADTPSVLHTLVEGFREHGYEWRSLHDIVPFTPAHRVDLPPGLQADDLLIGDVTGNGHDDVAFRDQSGQVSVISGSYTLPRNRAQRPAKEWLRRSFDDVYRLALADSNGDGRDDLIAYHRDSGEVQAFESDALSFAPNGTLLGSLPAGIDRLYPASINGDTEIDLYALRDRDVYATLLQSGKWGGSERLFTLPDDATLLIGDIDGDGAAEPFYYAPDDESLHLFRRDGDRFVKAGTFPVPDPRHIGQVLTGDTNGDGRVDVILGDLRAGIWEVLEGQSDLTFRPLANRYGPWASGAERAAMTADFDGNGKADLASFDPEHRSIDLSLSFRK